MQPAAFYLTKRGASHIKRNKECQDASLSVSTEEYAVAVVCDGHGGDDYVRSAKGSSLACSIALKNIVSFLHDVNKEELQSHYDEVLKTLEASIIAGWSAAIHDHYACNPLTESELSILSEKARKKYLDGIIDSAYGTTLIAVVLTSEFWFGIHIGDGKCVAVNREGKFGQPIPWDEKCFLNATTSLCDSNALSNFRHFFSCKLPAAIFIGSDGIDDCFNTNEQLYNLYRTVLYSFATTDFEMAKADLEDYLPRLSAKGSGDDVSVAAVMDLDIIGDLSIIKEYDREKEKARIEENARIEAEKAAEERRRIEAEYAEKLRLREAARQAEEERRKQRTPPVEYRYCENCGERLPLRAKFCYSCGTPVQIVLSPPPAPQPLQEEEKTKDLETKPDGESPVDFGISSAPGEPQSDGDKPEQATTEPEQAATEPEQAATEPEQVATEPEQAATEPEQVATEPEQAATEPVQDETEDDDTADDVTPTERTRENILETETSPSGICSEEPDESKQEKECEDQIAGASPVADE